MFSPMTFDERERRLIRLPLHTRDNTTQTQALASLPTPYITCTTESSSFIDSSSLFQVHESHTPVNPNVTSTHVNTVTSDRPGIGHNIDLRYGHEASTPGFVGHREMHTRITEERGFQQTQPYTPTAAGNFGQNLCTPIHTTNISMVHNPFQAPRSGLPYATSAGQSASTPQTYTCTHPIPSQSMYLTPGTMGSNPYPFYGPDASLMGVPQLLTGYNTPGKVKVLEPETFDGSPSGTDTNEYFIHFEQVSDWNEWTEHQRARMLTIKLRGEAQKLLSSLSYTQFTDYATLKQALIQRFSPKERELTYRCEFRNRRRMKDEQCSDYGFALRRLAQRAYPNIPYLALEVQLIDQFIMGLGSLELEKHVQFHHPKTLDEAINLAMEYTSVCGNLDKTLKPPLEKTCTLDTNTDNATTFSSLTLLPLQTSLSEADLERIISQIIDKKFVELGLSKRADNSSNVQLRGRSPIRQNNSPVSRGSLTRTRESTPIRLSRENKAVRFDDHELSENQTYRPIEIKCTYCDAIIM